MLEAKSQTTSWVYATWKCEAKIRARNISHFPSILYVECASQSPGKFFTYNILRSKATDYFSLALLLNHTLLFTLNLMKISHSFCFRKY